MYDAERHRQKGRQALAEGREITERLHRVRQRAAIVQASSQEVISRSEEILRAARIRLLGLPRSR